MLRFEVLPIVGDAHNDFHDENGTQDKFGSDVEGDSEIVLPIAEFDEPLGSANDNKQQADEIDDDYYDLHEQNQDCFGVCYLVH